MSNLKTSLYDWHLTHKARMVPFGGWEMPVQYIGLVAEHKVVRNGAGLFDISHMARFDLVGPDALALLDKVCTNSIEKMQVGQVRYSLVCNETGGILDDVLVYRWSDHFMMVVNASNREKILTWLREHAKNVDVTITDNTFATGMLALQGPKAIEMCEDIFATSPASLAYYYATPTKWGDRECILSRTGYTGEDGIEVIVANEYVVELADLFVSRGALPCGLGARDTLRLEAGMPLYGHELNDTIDPLQAGLAWAVKFTKPEFVGRTELLERKENTQLPRRVGLAIEGKRAAREGSPVLFGDLVVGQVTSGSFSPTLERVIAMAYVPPTLTTIGMKLQVDIRGTTVAAEVVELPFYRRLGR